MKFLIIFGLFSVLNGTISPKKKKKTDDDDDDDVYVGHQPTQNHQKPKKPQTPSQLSPQANTVFDRKLVKEETTYREIVTNHASYSKNQMKIRRIENGETLVYVTPWNNHGYDIAKWFHKFTLVSPVWLQIKMEGIGLTVSGTHDVDRGWMDEVRDTGAKIVPRVIFEIHPNVLKQMLSDEESIKGIAEALLNTVLTHDLDGLVVEIWNSIQADMCDDVIHLMTHLADSLHGNGKKLILVIPPKREKSQTTPFTSDHFDMLADVVDYFSIMTYDYIGKMGAFNGPVPWIKESVEEIDPDEEYRRKILIGMNFYGRYIPNVKQQGIVDLLGRDYVKRLLELPIDLEEPLAWHPEAKEHFIYFEDPATNAQSVILYPTLYSISQRIELAQSLGCGISIWEIGQGLDYFYDLF